MITLNETLSASLEDYLETIYHVVVEKRAAKARDIAQRLKVNNSSVTGALRALSEKGLINYAPYDVITLTEKGNTHAEEIVRKHEALKEFFTKMLFIDPQEAEDAACKMEHTVSRSVINRLIQFVEFIEICPRGGDDLIQAFWNHSQHDEPYEHCETCIAGCIETLRRKKKGIGDQALTTMSIMELSPGQKGKILKLPDNRKHKKHLADLGIHIGGIVEVEGFSSRQQTVDIKVSGYHISLSEDLAAKIMVGQYRV